MKFAGFIKLISLSLVILLLAGCASMNNSVNSPTPLKPFNESYKVKRLWSDQVSSGSRTYKLQPSYAIGNIYTVGSQGDLVATNALTGQRVWAQNLNVPISAGASSSSKYVSVASRKGMLYTLNASNGKVLWKKQLSDTALAAPEISQESIFVKTIDGNLVAFNAKTGQQKWIYNNGSPGLVLEGSSMPQAFGNTVIAGFSDGHLLAFNLSSGKILWNKTIAVSDGITEVQQLVGIDVTPVIKNDSVYVATYQGNIVAINLANGEYFWQHKMSSHTGLTVGSNRVVISATNGVVWAYDRLSGGIDWRQNDLMYRGITGPTIMGKTILIADAEGYLNWLNAADGAFVARASIRGSINTAPLVENRTAYVLSTNGTLSAYALSPI